MKTIRWDQEEEVGGTVYLEVQTPNLWVDSPPDLGKQGTQQSIRHA